MTNVTDFPDPEGTVTFLRLNSSKAEIQNHIFFFLLIYPCLKTNTSNLKIKYKSNRLVTYLEKGCQYRWKNQQIQILHYFPKSRPQLRHFSCN